MGSPRSGLTTCASAAGDHAGARTNLRFLSGSIGGCRPHGVPRSSGLSAACAGLGSSARRALTDSRYSHLAAWRMTMAVVTPRIEMAFRGGEQSHAPEDLSAH